MTPATITTATTSTAWMAAPASALHLQTTDYMETILSRGSDNRVVMSNGRFARTLAIGTLWTKLRIGIRFAINDGAANIGGGPIFAFGLCHGTTNIYGDATTDHFLGYRSRPRDEAQSVDGFNPYWPRV